MLHARSQHVDPADGILQKFVKGTVMGVQVPLLILQDLLQALRREQ